jgi:hypothetical protein
MSRITTRIAAAFVPTTLAALTALVLLPGLLRAQQAPTIPAQKPAPVPQAAAIPSNTPRIRWEHSVQPIESGPWKGNRTPDGQPDVAGDWSNTISNHNNFTDPQGNIPGDPSSRNRKLGARTDRAPSRVSDPADGQVPFQPWARAVQEDLVAHLFDPTKPEYVEPLARCAPAGIPKSFAWHGYEIRQFPNYIVFLFNSGTRVVHLDNSPPLPDNIKLWNGDSRGHWEGNTLVVSVHNYNAKARFARTGEFASDRVQIEERYVFAADGKRYNYVARFTDPSVYTQPFTVTIPARRYTVADSPDDWHYEVAVVDVPGLGKVADHYERTCVENNGGFGRVAQPAPKSSSLVPAVPSVPSDTAAVLISTTTVESAVR